MSNVKAMCVAQFVDKNSKVKAYLLRDEKKTMKVDETSVINALIRKQIDIPNLSVKMRSISNIYIEFKPLPAITLSSVSNDLTADEAMKLILDDVKRKKEQQTNSTNTIKTKQIKKEKTKISDKGSKITVYGSNNFSANNSEVKNYLNSIAGLKPLTKEENAELISRYNNGEKSLKDKIIEGNLKLVVSVVKRYINRGVPFEDLIQEGNIALIKSIESFDAEKGSLSTYATGAIEKAIMTSIYNNQSTVRIPVHTRDKMIRYNKEYTKYQIETGNVPTDDEMAAILNETVDNIKLFRAAQQGIVSIDSDANSNDDGESLTLLDVIADTHGIDQPTMVIRNELMQTIREALNKLTDKEKEVIVLRYGLDDGVERSLEQTATAMALRRALNGDLEYYISRQSIFNIEKSALKKLKCMNSIVAIK